jgi:hypothetical protein
VLSNSRNDSSHSDRDSVPQLSVPLYSRHCDNRLITRPYRSVLYLSLGISSGHGWRTTGCFEMSTVVIVKLLECVCFCVLQLRWRNELLVEKVWTPVRPSVRPATCFIFEIILKISTCLRIGRSGDRFPMGARFSATVQNVPGAHPWERPTRCTVFLNNLLYLDFPRHVSNK